MQGIRNTVIGTVVGGLLLAFILWVLDLLKPGLRAIWNILQTLVGLLATTIEVPVWLALLVAASLGALSLAILKLRAERKTLLTPGSVVPAEGDGSSTISLDGLKESDRSMLSVLFAADGDRVDVPALAEITSSSKLEVESAMERLAKRGFVDVHYNYVYGTSWTLTPEGRDKLLSLRGSQVSQ